MKKKYTSKTIELDKLILDRENPRFAELYNGSSKESDIIEYLLYTESADEIAEAISKAEEFYDDRPLWVFKKGEKYIVKDGNRRCSAVKALQLPNKYGLDVSKFEIEKLPVLEYKSLADLETRIRLEHNSSLFKKWGRIAKALEIYRLFSSGSSLDSLTEIDSAPKDFIKIATFYHKAAAIKGEEFKKLVREGRGKTGGKTIVFERLFKSRAKCGYNFKRKTSEIIIKDEALFQSYINAIVPYLTQNPNTTSRIIDDTGTDQFLEKLKVYGFPPEEKHEDTSKPKDDRHSISGPQNDTSNNVSQDNSSATRTPQIAGTADSSGATGKPAESNTVALISSTETSGSSTTSNTRHSVKKKPSLKRKKIPGPLKSLIDECYNLDQNNFANSKTALTRVTFECVLKFIVENTKQGNGKPIANSNHFQTAFKSKQGTPLPYTNFTALKNKFTELITHTATRKAFEVLDLEMPHQIIHNYKVGAIPKQAKDLCDNLIEIIEFMLQEEDDLLRSLNLSKL